MGLNLTRINNLRSIEGTRIFLEYCKYYSYVKAKKTLIVPCVNTFSLLNGIITRGGVQIWQTECRDVPLLILHLWCVYHFREGYTYVTHYPTEPIRSDGGGEKRRRRKDDDNESFFWCYPMFFSFGEKHWITPNLPETSHFSSRALAARVFSSGMPQPISAFRARRAQRLVGK